MKPTKEAVLEMSERIITHIETGEEIEIKDIEDRQLFIRVVKNLMKNIPEEKVRFKKLMQKYGMRFK